MSCAGCSNNMSQERNDYRGLCRPDETCCYLFIRFNLSRFQNYVNSLVKQVPVSTSYTGTCVGITKEIECLEGAWPKDKCIAILQFECLCEAERWIQSTPEVKQTDWVDGDADIVGVNVRAAPPRGKEWFQLIDVQQIYDYDCFCTNYVEKVNPYLSKLGATSSPGVVAASTPHGGNGPKTFRGRWYPNTLIVNQFCTRKDFTDAYCSPEYQPLKKARQQVSKATVVLFKLMPLFNKAC